MMYVTVGTLFFEVQESQRNTLICVYVLCITNFFDKAKLMLLKLIHLFAREVLFVKKLEIEETKTT